MKLLDVTLHAPQRHSRRVTVPRAKLGGHSRLGARVVLRDHDGEFYAGDVLAIDDTEATVQVGVRLPEEFAQERLDSGETALQDPMQELLDLLGEARTTREDR